MEQEKKKGGRLFRELDWDHIDKMLMSNCSAAQTAASVGIHPDTLYDRCLRDKGMHYADYSAKMRAKGESSLHAKQFEVATGGNTTMLIWLGKQRLGQKEDPNADNEKPTTAIDELVQLIKEARCEKESKTSEDSPRE